MILKLFVLITLFCANFIQSANILALFSSPSKSHFIVFQPLLEKLTERGHQVDVLSHFPRKQRLIGYTDLSVRGNESDYKNFYIDLEKVKRYSFRDILTLMNYNCGVNTCKNIKSSMAIRNLLRSKKHYDLIITEIFVSDCLMGFVKIFDAPIIGMTSSVNLPWSSDFIGLPDNPAYIPNYFSPYTEDMTFYEKVMNTVVLYSTKIWHKYYPNDETNKFIKEMFGRNTPHVDEFRKNVSLIMVNSHFSLQQSRPLPPNFVEIGGIHLKSNPVLPKEFESYMETDLKGVIFLSFGTLFKSEKFPDNKLKPFFEALSEIPYKILWKGNRSDVAKHLNVPTNVHFITWAPQFEILCHPNLKLFISHCGLASAQEAIFCGKPIFSFPVWVDQLATAKMISHKGLGLSIPLLQDFTKEMLSNVLHQLLENPKYTKNARRLSELFQDRLTSPLDTAVYWTEYIIRHKGAPHLMSKAADLSFYEYHCLDIAGSIVLVILILVWGFYKILKKILSVRINFKVSKNKLN